MTNHITRIKTLLDSPSVIAKRSPTASSWPFQNPMPPDIAAFQACCAGLDLADGTRILGLEQSFVSTKWLREEKSLDWDDDLFIIGERDDLIILRDMDVHGVRAGGGILEAATDGLETLRRVAMDLVGYLEARTGFCDPNPAPESRARVAIAERNIEALAAISTLMFYPGNEADAALAALTLGELHARAGRESDAMAAFTHYADIRARTARRGAQAMERAAAFRAAARVTESVGATALAEACRQRAAG